MKSASILKEILRHCTHSSFFWLPFGRFSENETDKYKLKISFVIKCCKKYMIVIQIRAGWCLSTLFCVVLPGMNFLVEQDGSDQHDNFSQDG